MNFFKQKLPLTAKRPLVFFYDTTAIMAAMLLAIYLKYGAFSMLLFHHEKFTFELYIIALVQITSFYSVGLYKGIWRFSSIHDLHRVIKGVSFGVLFSIFFIFFWNRASILPRTLFIIDWFILLVLVGGGRFLYRLIIDYQFNMKGEKVLIYGAGVNGEQLLREIRRQPHLGLQVIGFIDDNLHKRKSTIHGVPIIGPFHQLDKILLQTKCKKLFISISALPSARVREITENCVAHEIEVSILPPLGELIANKGLISQVRKVSYEDLLGRESVELDKASLGLMIKDKVVLITGAGGSIGSELCQQIAKFQPKHIILFEKTEYFLYQVDMSLRERFPNAFELTSIVSNILDQEKFAHTLEKYRPQLIFHAAAYKHVPLMEENAYSAIMNNVKGTYIAAMEAAKHQVEKFVLVSTDKAVKPTNIMGASKRLAELICQHFNENKQFNTQTKFITVRFGNVLGSSGSVIPLFKKQIEAGGPVTVTHPNITRYFMSIPEACQLVLQAASLGDGGEIFVLDMGEPIKILDLAKHMIHLSGYTPNVDILIKFSGLRPGEKLYEELFTDSEYILPTSNSKVKIAKLQLIHRTTINEIIKLFSISPELPTDEIKLLIKKTVPEFNFTLTKPFPAKTSASTISSNSYQEEILPITEQAIQ